MSSTVNMLSSWRNLLPDFLPIIGKFCGSVLRDWVEVEQITEGEEVELRYILSCHLEFEFTNNRFGRYIRVRHELSILDTEDDELISTIRYGDVGATRYQDYFNGHRDCCLRRSDWEKILFIETELVRRCRQVQAALSNYSIDGDDVGQTDHESNGFEMYAVGQAVNNIMKRFENDVYDYLLGRW